MVLSEWVTRRGEPGELVLQEGSSIRPDRKPFSPAPTHRAVVHSQFSWLPLDGSVSTWQQRARTAPQGQPASPMEPGKSPQSCEAAGQAEALVMGTAYTSALLCFRQVRQVPLCSLPWGSYQGSLLAEPEHRGPRSQ